MKKILIIQSASIGDVILATPVVEKLHTTFPEARIDLLVKKGNETLFTGHPFINELLIWDKRSRSLMNFDKLLHRIRKTRYDLIVNIQRFLLTGLMTACSGAKMKIGFDKNPLSYFFTLRVPHVINDSIHEVDRNLSLIASFAGSGPVTPKLYPTADDSNRVESYRTAMFYTISPASLWFTKQYPAQQWISFIRMIPPGREIYLLGSRTDHALCEQIRIQSGSVFCKNLAGELTFLESAALMSKAKMNFTNDSAPMHLASAVNAPVTAIFCSTVAGFGFGPLSDDSSTIQTDEQLLCRPCGLHGIENCPEKHFRCALSIPPDKLLARC